VTVPLGPADASAGDDQQRPARTGLPAGKAELSRTGWSDGGRQTGVNLTTRQRLRGSIAAQAPSISTDERRVLSIMNNSTAAGGGRRMSMMCACANYVTSGDDDYVNVARATVAVRVVRGTVRVQQQYSACALYSTHLQIHARTHARTH